MTDAPQDLLRTKLFIPLIPSEVIPRPHLVERLNIGVAGKLSLVIAPAGYGKTTLVTTWLHQLTALDANNQVVWLSMDEGDNDLRRFFAYFVAALCQLDEGFVAIKEAFLQDSRDELSAAAVVIALVNQVVEYGQPVILILDDYHEITEPSIHEAVSFWLDNQPPNFHFVITSRAAPPLPLPRLRVRRQVTEIDTEALRFSRSESSDFLNQHMHLNLSADDIAQLDSITEGWVASLQLAALSLQDKDNPTESIHAFKGDNRYIVDYLVSEVLHRQPGYIRDFLLQTSILERLNVQLCNAVTEQVGSQHILETLDQTRLFVIPLDDRRHWYRYHHLFAECLQTELERAKPEEVAIYHERASQWFNDNGFVAEATQHAFAAGNNQLAANLIATNARKLLWSQGGSQQMWQWLQQLPDEEVQTSPYLLIATTWLELYLFGNYGPHIHALLNKALALAQAPNAPYDSSEVTKMTTEIALIHLTIERLRGNIEKALQYGEQILEQLHTLDEPLIKVSAIHSVVVIHCHTGNVVQSLKYSNMLLETRAINAPVDHTHYVTLAYRIDAFRLQGQLYQAEQVIKNMEPNLLQRQSAGAAMLIVSWAELLYEQNHLTLAFERLLPALEILKPQTSMAVVVQTGAITLARIYQVQGENQEGLTLLKDTLQTFKASGVYYPSARISATEALLHLRQRNLAAAKAWAEKSGLSADDEPTYLLEIDYLVLARVLIADGAAQTAQILLDKLEKVTMDSGRTARLIEVYILQALAHLALGKREQALARLGQAVDLAQPEGFVRLFVDEGDVLIPLFKQMVGRGVAVAYIRTLLPLFDELPQAQPVSPPGQNAGEFDPDSFNLLLNPLTDRELATLRYLASNLTIPEIAEQMVVAPSTVRTYVKRIYGKLDVHNRIEAVNRARALGLIA